MRKLPRPTAFAWLWLSEIVFDLGAAMATFSLGIWVFERTGSAEQFAYAILCSVVPAFLVAPVAGALADGLDRRAVMLASDMVVAVLVAALAAVAFQGRLAVWHLYAFNALVATFGAIRTPAYLSVVSAIVPAERLARANGLIGFGKGAMLVAAPWLAGMLMARGGLPGILSAHLLLVTAATFFVGMAAMRLRHVLPRPTRARGFKLPARAREAVVTAWGYFRREPSMRRLAVYALGTEALFILVSELITPMVLSSHSSRTLGQVMSCGALGGLLGHLIPLWRPFGRPAMPQVLAANLVLSVCVVLAGWIASPAGWCACAFIGMAAASVSMASTRSLWMRHLPQDRQGSLFAMLGASQQLLFCVVMLAGARLGERVLEPALAPGGRLATSLGTLVGTGPGRGFAVLFIACGAGCALWSLLALANGRFKQEAAGSTPGPQRV
jgi:diaminobutyrate-2-oxoglutarate transaminase